MAFAATVGKEILPGGRDFLLLPRSTPGSGGEERSDEVPEPGVEILIEPTEIKWVGIIVNYGTPRKSWSAFMDADYLAGDITFAP